MKSTFPQTLIYRYCEPFLVPATPIDDADRLQRARCDLFRLLVVTHDAIEDILNAIPLPKEHWSCIVNVQGHPEGRASILPSMLIVVKTPPQHVDKVDHLLSLLLEKLSAAILKDWKPDA